MTKPNSTEIIFIVDRSGSMTSIAEPMSQGFDEFINKQKLIPGECRVTVAQFDDEYTLLYTGKPLSEVPPFKIEPRGMTALFDAVGKTLADTGNRLAAMKEEDRPSQVLIVIITDGGENHSKEYTDRSKIFDMITHQREKYSWEFVFLGANQDAIGVGTSLGISATNAVTYTASTVGTQGLMSGLSRSVGSYRQRKQPRMENLYDQKAYDATQTPDASDKSSDPSKP